MKNYEYVNLKVGKTFTAGNIEHREIINEYAKKGYKYIGFIPTSIANCGRFEKIDLIFEIDTH